MFRKILILVLCLSAFSLVKAQDMAQPTFVLVHGAFQDETGWADVITALEADGYTAVAVRYPELPINEITLDTYRDAVIAVVEEQDAPVVLVGHSFGGVVISAVAEAIPNELQSIVYLVPISRKMVKVW